MLAVDRSVWFACDFARLINTYHHHLDHYHFNYYYCYLAHFTSISHSDAVLTTYY